MNLKSPADNPHHEDYRADPNEGTELVVSKPQPIISISTGASIAEVVNRRRLIKDLMQQVLVEGEHYGSIPGTGSDKKVLLKSGAEKIGTMFNLAPKVSKEEIVELGEGHREYRITIGLWHYPTGMFVGEGVGSCSTKETKYRYRNVSDFEVTDQAIPADAKEKKQYYRALGYGMKKVDGRWVWVKYGDEQRSENPDIADVWNTCYKMAEKRAKVNATLSATGASDFFTQDLEENHGNHGRDNLPTVPEKPAEAKPAPKKAPPPEDRATLWAEKIIGVDEEERNGKMVYSVQFEGGRVAGTLSQELANKAYTLSTEDPDRVFRAAVKPGRYPGTFMLTGLE
ncbi:MAG TPA: hypothetical protein VFH87_01660 [Candidatus Udaeobacter sp.]|nr:hypothetical protein [Candidatus Udaeobacter sp.]